MKKRIIMGVIGMALSAHWPVFAAEHAGGVYCAKHCNAMQLSKEVKALETEIAADKAALKSQGGAEKIATLNSKKERVKKHLDRHIRELADMKAELDKAEAELNQTEVK